MEPRLEYYIKSCVFCGICSQVCPAGAIKTNGRELVTDKDVCTGCFVCVDYCVSGARRVSGKSITAPEVFDIMKRDKIYYNKSGGGVTFSGGEPLLQPEFLWDLLVLSRRAGIHTAVESALCVGEDIVESIAPCVGLFLCDIKVMDDELHKKYTGMSNKNILSNIRLLSKLGAKVLIRIPVVKGVNADAGNMLLTADFLLNETNIKKIELLKLHRLAAHKYNALAIKDTLTGFEGVSEDDIAELKNLLIKKGLTVYGVQ